MANNSFVKYLHINIILVIFCVFFVSGCTIDVNKDIIVDKLKEMDAKIGREMKEINISTSTSISTNIQKKKDNSSILTEEEKDKIDKWLEEKGLNRYGDSKGVIYKNGSPLFNEKTGESIERFKYILNRYPNILK